jgi:hypothetical protein
MNLPRKQPLVLAGERVHSPEGQQPNPSDQRTSCYLSSLEAPTVTLLSNLDHRPDVAGVAILGYD